MRGRDTLRVFGQGMLLVAVLAGSAQAQQMHAMVEARIAVPGPSLPVLPMTLRQRLALSAGGRNEWNATRTERLTDSSLRPLSLAPALLAHGAQIQLRHRNIYWGGEGHLALHGSGCFSGMGTVMTGFNLARSSWSLLTWYGLGIMAWESRYTTSERSVSTPVVDNHGDHSLPLPAPVVVERRTVHDDSSGVGGLVAAGLSVSLLDDQPLSPYAAGRLLMGPLGETHDSVGLRNPVDFSRVTFDAGVRWRFARLWQFRLGLGAVSYLGPRFHGVDVNAQVGFHFDAKSPPDWWSTGNKPVERSSVSTELP